MAIKWIDDTDFFCKNQKVLYRVDLNVPMDDNLNIRDDSKIIAILPSIDVLLKKQAKIILISHFGRPNGIIQSKYSLKPIAVRLRSLLDIDIIFVEDCIGHGVVELIKHFKANTILMLENTRFHAGEEKNSNTFSKMMANKIDIYVNDAFGVIHREHASTVGVTNFISKSVGGLLIKKEINALNTIKYTPKRPFILILGGSKVKDKLCLLTKLLFKADKIIIGGSMSFTFLKALGENIGSIEVEQKNLTIVRNILSKSKNKAKIILPIDHIAILKCNKNSTTRIVNKNTFKKNEIGLDIGPKTIALYKHEIGKTGTVFWNGPMGVFELTKFAKGTFAIAKIIAEFNGVTIIGGGESTSVISILKLNNKISHISTGGGASISFLVGNKLTTLNKLGFYD